MLLRGVSLCPREAEWPYTPAGGYGTPPHIVPRRLPPALPPSADTPTDKGNTQANLTVYTHAPKTHTNTKQQGGISVHVFYCEYVYRLMYVRQCFVGALVCVGVSHQVLKGRHREVHTL